MAERIRFHLDEHIDPAVARGLRRHGIDVTTTMEAHLLSRSDQAQWEYARTSGRVQVYEVLSAQEIAGRVEFL